MKQATWLLEKESSRQREEQVQRLRRGACRATVKHRREGVCGQNRVTRGRVVGKVRKVRGRHTGGAEP